MKYLLILLLLSCQKEESGTTTPCGTVTNIFFAPNLQAPVITISYNGTFVKKDIGVLDAMKLRVGDLYCD